jgi:DNA-binding NarL/FixJ family response regulator
MEPRPPTLQALHALLIGDPHDERYRQLVRLALVTAGLLIDAEADLDEPVNTCEGGSFNLVVVASHQPAKAAAAIRSMTANPTCPPVVVVASTAHLSHFAEVMAAGACGYLLEGMDPMQFSRALECAVNGETVLPRAVVALVAAQVRLDSDPAVVAPFDSPLTRRERQVLSLLREGASTREIAERLNVAPVTVRTYVTSIVHKLGVKDRAEAARTPVGAAPRG